MTIPACPVDSSLSGRPKLSAVGKGFSTRIPSISLSTTVSLDCTGPTSPAGLYSGEEPPTLDLVPLTLVPLRRTSSNKYHQHIDDIAADDIQLGKVNCLILCKKVQNAYGQVYTSLYTFDQPSKSNCWKIRRALSLEIYFGSYASHSNNGCPVLGIKVSPGLNLSFINHLAFKSSMY